jgi:stage II sporulation protein P
MAQVDPTAPGLFCTVLPVPASGAALPVPGLPQAAPAPVSARAEPPGADAPDPGLVALYNTHTGETYALTDGVERVQGRGGVVRVAAVLEEELRRRGIRVLRTDKIHDGCYATSYLESEKTVRELVYTHPDLAALFDIHRDVKQPRAEATVKVEGRDVARVLIVVGSDARLPFPAWRQNFSFARRIADRAEALYPGLCLGVRVKEGRYNQFLHPRALLLEVGGVNNTLEEAEAAAKLFAVVLADVLLDNGTEAAAREAEE